MSHASCTAAAMAAMSLRLALQWQSVPAIKLKKLKPAGAGPRADYNLQIKAVSGNSALKPGPAGPAAAGL